VWEEPHYRKWCTYISAGRYTPAVTRGLSKPAEIYMGAFAAVNSQVHRPAGFSFVVLIVCMCNMIPQPCPALSPSERLGHKLLRVCLLLFIHSCLVCVCYQNVKKPQLSIRGVWQFSFLFFSCRPHLILICFSQSVQSHYTISYILSLRYRHTLIYNSGSCPPSVAAVALWEVVRIGCLALLPLWFVSITINNSDVSNYIHLLKYHAWEQYHLNIKYLF